MRSDGFLPDLRGGGDDEGGVAEIRVFAFVPDDEVGHGVGTTTSEGEEVADEPGDLIDGNRGAIYLTREGFLGGGDTSVHCPVVGLPVNLHVNDAAAEVFGSDAFDTRPKPPRQTLSERARTAARLPAGFWLAPRLPVRPLW